MAAPHSVDDSPAAGDLEAAAIVSGLQDTRFRHVEVHSSLESTQTLVVREGGPDGRVVIADHQRAGRGRAGRTWESPPGRSLLMSAAVRGIPPQRAPMASLAAGLAVAQGIEDVGGPSSRLKWPNDVQLNGGKVAGILGELVAEHDLLVVGMGVNVGQTLGELPPAVEATSLRLAMGRAVDRGRLAVAILRRLDGLMAAVASGDTAAWLGDYRARCATIGTRVRVELGARTVEGEATTVRDDGVLVVDGEPVLAGDVIHLRPA